MSAVEALAKLPPLTGGKRSAIRDLQREQPPWGEANFHCESAAVMVRNRGKLNTANVHRKGW